MRFRADQRMYSITYSGSQNDWIGGFSRAAGGAAQEQPSVRIFYGESLELWKTALLDALAIPKRSRVPTTADSPSYHRPFWTGGGNRSDDEPQLHVHTHHTVTHTFAWTAGSLGPQSPTPLDPQFS